MALDPVFGEAFALLPTPRVLGWRLRPFSLWHQLLLEEIDSPFVTGTAPTGPDLVRAVAICRCRHPYVRIDLPRGTGLYTLAHLAGRFRQHLERFKAYAKQAHCRPEVTIHPPKGVTGDSRGSAPEVFRLHLSVLALVHDRSAAWDCPAGQAEWYHMEAQRAKGVDVDYLTEKTRADWARLEAEDPETAEKCRQTLVEFRRRKKEGR